VFWQVRFVPRACLSRRASAFLVMPCSPVAPGSRGYFAARCATISAYASRDRAHRNRHRRRAQS
jgi:hypothetical protein